MNDIEAINLAQELIVGTWIPVEGDPSEALYFWADGRVCMVLLGGALNMPGRYYFLDKDTIGIVWSGSEKSEAESVVDAVNAEIAKTSGESRFAVRKCTVMAILVSEEELWTCEVNQDRVGHFRRSPW